MQKNSAPSKTKIILIGMLVILFSLLMLSISIFQIIKINKLNDKIAEQEREIEDLNNLYDQLTSSSATSSVQFDNV